MQYFKPAGNLFAGDCMPFFHEGVFRLFYLVDEGHHSGLGGLGGHQWAQATTTDLLQWAHQPLALAITQDWEGSICTGSVLFHDGLYHAFYATRTRQWKELLSHAVSRDGIHFEKTLPNPLAAPPPGYDPRHFRDPFAFYSQEDGRFHLLVTAQLSASEYGGRGGCLAHLTSKDLLDWQFEPPLLIPGLSGAPECSDYFAWNGWYYLIFSNQGIARYRVSSQPFGPWQRMAGDVLDSPAARVMKTAAFGEQRRIGAAWIGTREGDQDDGRLQFGGNVLLRELVQHPDGSLGTAFATELTPRGRAMTPKSISLGSGATVEGGQINLANWEGIALAKVPDVDRNFQLTLQVSPQPGAHEFHGLNKVG